MGMQADSSMAAWWGRQFDRIYCFHHTGMKGRYEAMRAELERVGKGVETERQGMASIRRKMDGLCHK